MLLKYTLKISFKRCKEYSVASETYIPDSDEVKEEIPNPPGPMGFEEMARQREAKLRKFRETKDVESRLIELKKALDNPSSDESTARDYYLLLIKKFIISSIEELNSISQEKPIVKHLAKMKKDMEQMPKFHRDQFTSP